MFNLELTTETTTMHCINKHHGNVLNKNPIITMTIHCYINRQSRQLYVSVILRVPEVIHSNMGTCDMPNMYALGLQHYISGKSLIPMLQLLHTQHRSVQSFNRWSHACVSHYYVVTLPS